MYTQHIAISFSSRNFQISMQSTFIGETKFTRAYVFYSGYVFVVYFLNLIFEYVYYFIVYMWVFVNIN